MVVVDPPTTVVTAATSPGLAAVDAAGGPTWRMTPTVTAINTGMA